MALTIPGLTEDRGASFIDTATKSNIQKLSTYCFDPSGCGDFTYRKSGTTLTINALGDDCRIVPLAVMSLRTIYLTDPTNPLRIVNGDETLLFTQILDFFGAQMIAACPET